MPSSSGAFAIVRNEQGFVLLGHRRDLDIWDLPGGRVERGEAPWDAAVRETREEVGLVVVVRGLVDVTWRPNEDHLVFTFQCDRVDGEAGRSDEADAVEYFDPQHLPRNVSPAKRDRILASVADPGGVRLQTRTDPSVRELLRMGHVF